jgi:hypothetical protein
MQWQPCARGTHLTAHQWLLLPWLLLLLLLPWLLLLLLLLPWLLLLLVVVVQVPEDKDNINGVQQLSLEATMINQNLSQQLLMKQGDRWGGQQQQQQQPGREGGTDSSSSSRRRASGSTHGFILMELGSQRHIACCC